MDLSKLKVGQTVVADDVLADKDYEEIFGIVRGYVNTGKFQNLVRQMKTEILKEIKDKLAVDGTVEVRRDYDGISQLDWLIEKMIGEQLSKGKINW